MSDSAAPETLFSSPPAVCMVFDEKSGNVFDAFEYTPENLRLKDREMHGSITLMVGMDFVQSVSSSLVCRLGAPQ